MTEEQEQRAMLQEAHEKATRLVAELERRAAEVSQNPPKIDPVALEEGEMAMRNALASARRMLEALNGAMEISKKEPS